MSILLFDCSGGLSGAALAGALVDLGVKPSVMEWELSLLPLGDFHLHFDRRDDGGITWSIHAGATHMDEPGHEPHAHEESHADGHHLHEEPHGHDHDHEDSGHAHACRGHDSHGPVWSAAKTAAMLQDAGLSSGVRDRALAVLARLGKADLTLGQIAAVVCVAAGWDALQPERAAFFGRGRGTEEAVGAAIAEEFPTEPGMVPPLADARRGIGFDPAAGARVVAVWGAAIV